MPTNTTTPIDTVEAWREHLQQLPRTGTGSDDTLESLVRVLDAHGSRVRFGIENSFVVVPNRKAWALVVPQTGEVIHDSCGTRRLALELAKQLYVTGIDWTQPDTSGYANGRSSSVYPALLKAEEALVRQDEAAARDRLRHEGSTNRKAIAGSVFPDSEAVRAHFRAGGGSDLSVEQQRWLQQLAPERLAIAQNGLFAVIETDKPGLFRLTPVGTGVSLSIRSRSLTDVTTVKGRTNAERLADQLAENIVDAEGRPFDWAATGKAGMDAARRFRSANDETLLEAVLRERIAFGKYENEHWYLYEQVGYRPDRDETWKGYAFPDEIEPGDILTHFNERVASVVHRGSKWILTLADGQERSFDRNDALTALRGDGLLSRDDNGEPNGEVILRLEIRAGDAIRFTCHSLDLGAEAAQWADHKEVSVTAVVGPSGELTDVTVRVPGQESTVDNSATGLEFASAKIPQLVTRLYDGANEQLRVESVEGWRVREGDLLLSDGERVEVIGVSSRHDAPDTRTMIVRDETTKKIVSRTLGLEEIVDVVPAAKRTREAVAEVQNFATDLLWLTTSSPPGFEDLYATPMRNGQWNPKVVNRARSLAMSL